VHVHSMVAIGRPAKERTVPDRFEDEWVHRERW
jgi:hypothetical protein